MNRDGKGAGRSQIFQHPTSAIFESRCAIVFPKVSMKTQLSSILFLIATSGLHGQVYDIVLSHGRVIDPESGLDAVRNIGISGKRIAAISTTPLRGRTEINASKLVVSPGFIDLHSHAHYDDNYHYNAHDRATTP